MEKPAVSFRFRFVSFRFFSNAGTLAVLDADWSVMTKYRGVLTV